MILGDFLKALAQMGDGRFWGVIVKGVGLSILLLSGMYGAFVTVIQYFTPDAVSLPWIGPVTGLETLLGWASLGLMIVLSVFLMVPVAAAFAGIFADDVADAVEARHYPALPPAQGPGIGDSLVSAANFLGLVVAFNVLALFLYPFLGPLAPLLFWALNGDLLGREYFAAVASRRIGRIAAKDLRKKHRWSVWAAGTLMAAPLSIPLVNLIIPVLGAATFTHLFHRLNRITT